MKYKVGDKVRVRPDLKTYFKYYMEDNGEWDMAILDMLDLAGTVVKITGVGKRGYSVEGCDFNFTDEMFQELYKKSIIIETDGITTTGKLLNEHNIVERIFTFVCRNEDEFDFSKISRIALETLISNGYD